MTREEAINAITQFIENYAYGNDLIGLKMAIEALKNEQNLKYEIEDLKNKVKYLESIERR